MSWPECPSTSGERNPGECMKSIVKQMQKERVTNSKVHPQGKWKAQGTHLLNLDLVLGHLLRHCVTLDWETAMRYDVGPSLEPSTVSGCCAYQPT